MTEVAQSCYIVHAESFGVLFCNILTQLTDLRSNVGYYTICTMKNLVSVIGGHQQVRFSLISLKTFNNVLCVMF